MAKPSIDRKEIYRSIMKYCDYQDRCEQEVRLKLNRLGVSEAEIPSIVEQLIDEDLINEERFALNYTRGKFRIKNWGKIRIRMELKSKGISASHIAKALGNLDTVTYHKSLHLVAQHKLDGLTSGSDQMKRKKLWDALIYRGWEKELVYDKIRELLP